MAIRKASKKNTYIKMAIAGPGGSGKTYTALTIAHQLGSKILVFDTEGGSSEHYQGHTDQRIGIPFCFDIESDITQFSPVTYTNIIQEAQKLGYDVLILDSFSHSWSGTGGAIEMVDKAKIRHKGNSFTAWSEVTPIHNRLLDAIVRARLHIICTLRTKVEYIIEDNNGKKTVSKKGLAPIQRDGVEYEFDIFCEMDDKHNFVVGKTRCADLDGLVVNRPGTEIIEPLKAWIGSQPHNGSNKPTTAEADNTKDLNIQVKPPEPELKTEDDEPLSIDETDPLNKFMALNLEPRIREMIKTIPGWLKGMNPKISDTVIQNFISKISSEMGQESLEGLKDEWYETVKKLVTGDLLEDLRKSGHLPPAPIRKSAA